MRSFFRSPNAGQTSLSLQHSTSPRSGYRPNLGANRDGYPMGGIPIRTGFKKGGKVMQDAIRAGARDMAKTGRGKKFRQSHFKDKKTGRTVLDTDRNRERYGMKKGGWIQDVNKSIKKRGTKGKCTPITKKGCTGRAKALAKTFKKMAKKRKS